MLSEFYVTRDSDSSYVEVRPAHIGIKKTVGCVAYHDADFWSGDAMELPPADCIYIFGFVPEKGEAWLIEGRKRTKVELEFSKSSF